MGLFLGCHFSPLESSLTRVRGCVVGSGKQVAVVYGSTEDSPFFSAHHKIIIKRLGAAYICPVTHWYKCQCVVERCFFISQLPLRHPQGVGSRPGSPLSSAPGAVGFSPCRLWISNHQPLGYWSNALTSRLSASR